MKIINIGYEFCADKRKGVVINRVNNIALIYRNFEYEIVEIQSFNTEQTFRYKDGATYTIPAGSEYLPSARQWGEKGFTILDKDLAHDIINKINQLRKQYPKETFRALYRQIVNFNKSSLTNPNMGDNVIES